MKRLCITLLGGAMALMLSGSQASAGSFTECPAVALDTSCGVLITVNPGGGLSFGLDPTQPPYEGVEDTLVGVLNNSGVVVSSISLSTAPGGIPIFAFDFDGACSGSGPGITWTPPAGCPFGPTGYEGADNLGNADSFSGINAFATSGSVVFGGGGLAAGGTAWFSLEGPPTGISGVVTPEPTSLLLMGSGLMGLLLKRRRRA